MFCFVHFCSTYWYLFFNFGVLDWIPPVFSGLPRLSFHVTLVRNDLSQHVSRCQSLSWSRRYSNRAPHRRYCQPLFSFILVPGTSRYLFDSPLCAEEPFEVTPIQLQSLCLHLVIIMYFVLFVCINVYDINCLIYIIMIE